MISVVTLLKDANGVTIMSHKFTVYSSTRN
jgi:hypothetical protein